MIERKLLTEWMSFDYTPDMIKESRDINGGKVMMKGILQKADTLNQNGRIYPNEILEREVRNYQKFIKENRALGAKRTCKKALFMAQLSFWIRLPEKYYKAW